MFYYSCSPNAVAAKMAVTVYLEYLIYCINVLLRKVIRKTGVTFKIHFTIMFLSVHFFLFNKVTVALVARHATERGVVAAVMATSCLITSVTCV